MNHFADRHFHESGGVKRNLEGNPCRKVFFETCDGLADRLGGLDSVCTRLHEDCHVGRWHPVHGAGHPVALGSQFDPGHIRNPQNGSFVIAADDDVPEFLWADESSLGADVIGEGVLSHRRLGCNRAGRKLGVLLANGCGDVRGVQFVAGELVRIEPHADGVVGVPEDHRIPNTRGALHLVDDIQDAVVREKGGVILAARRVNGRHAQNGGRTFGDGYSKVADFLW
ncbi:MAG: hypothetical protein BWY82_00928 [Verrucomicrobia bacterium ADurb.Bin474]|nr:MAG: hypothetical protein BWY82_00928 [Verrucomicrobia bacterium ADurb.Bin474]